MVVKVKPTWNDSSKPGNDKTGWKRGYRGIDRNEDCSEFFRTFDPKAHAKIYGPTVRAPRTDGAQTVMVNVGKDPGTITNRSNSGTSSGYDGVDE